MKIILKIILFNIIVNLSCIYSCEKEDWEMVDRKPIEIEGTMTCAKRGLGDEMRVLRLFRRSAVIAIAHMDEVTQSIYLNVNPMPLYDNPSVDPDRYDQYKQLSWWWRQTFSGKEVLKKELILIAPKKSEEDDGEEERRQIWLKVLNKIIGASHPLMFTYEDADDTRMSWVEPDDMSIKFTSAEIVINYVTKRKHHSFEPLNERSEYRIPFVEK